MTEPTQPAGEHHVGSLDLTGEGNAPEDRDEDRLPNNISPVAVEAAAKAHIENAGWDWNDLDQGDLDHEATKAVLIADMRIALRAAYPAIRQQVAEEIATALLAEETDPERRPHPERIAGWSAAAERVREIGGKS